MCTEKFAARSIATSPDPFDPATRANVHDLVTLRRMHCQLPEGVAKGYSSTIRIWWHKFEIEVFGGHYELYRFYDGSTGIQHFEHKSLGAVST
jgi:hypothetical protein